MYKKLVIFIVLVAIFEPIVPQSEKYEPCEIDLIDQYPNEMKDHLDQKCIDLVGEQRGLAKTESETFERFITKMNELEITLDLDFVEDDEVGSIPKMQTELRFTIYNETESWKCKVNQTSYAEFLECLIIAEESMINLVDGYMNETE